MTGSGALNRRATAGTGAGPTSPETICASVRRGIIRGDYPPGERLTEDALAEEYGVSRIPVREALRVLAAEGFIRVQPYYGTFVAELTPDQATDLLSVRGALEPLAAGLAAQRRSPEQLVQLKAVVEQGLAATRDGRYDEVAALNGTFHELLAVASGNSTLLSLIGQLRDKIDWVYSVEVRRRASDSWGEHAEIVDAIEHGDATRASDALRAHIEKASTAYRLRGDSAPAT